MIYSPFTDDENSVSPDLDQKNQTDKENNNSDTENVSKIRSNCEISETFNKNYRFRGRTLHNHYNDRSRRNIFHYSGISRYDQRRSSENFKSRNSFRGGKPNNRYHSHYRDNKHFNDRRSSLFKRNHYFKADKKFNERVSSDNQTTDVNILGTNLSKSPVMTNVKNISKIQEDSTILSKHEMIDSLTKSSVNISPSPSISINSFDTSVTDHEKLPVPTETARENIKPGESFFKDNNYKNIKSSEIFSPTIKEQPTKKISKRPTVIKSPPTIDYPNRDLRDFISLLKVGEGSYGTVYQAHDTKTNELVALKRVIMDREYEGFPITAVREIKILRQLNHKNVVKLIEVISHEKDIYLVFEYMNHDLMGLLANKYICFNEQSILCIIKQILEGLQYCHSKNFLHRDLKCSNILLNNKGEVKLGDFGLSRFYNAAFPGRPYTNKVISLWYRPIELLLGEESYGFGIDIWSCGCILAELFTRQPLFHTNSELQLIELITDLCGTPNTSDWPEIRKLPLYRTIKMKPKPMKLFQVYQQIIPHKALLLLDQMLKLNPMKRITASEALQSSWIISNDKNSLTSNPLSILPSWIDCHELRAKMMKNKC
ncbi:unnamed protein product [Diamesa hyperborea]